MRRRIVLATVGVVALALVLAGVFTLVLLRQSARSQVRRQLVTQAQDIAAQVDQIERPAVLKALSRALKLNDASQVTFLRNGAMEGELPAGITVTDIRPAILRTGRTVSGVRGRLAYAAVPVTLKIRPNALTVVVVTRDATPGADRGLGWFLLASAVSLLLAWAVSNSLARRIAAPLQAVEATTRRMAAGDLDARAAVEPGADPELASLVQSVNTLAANLSRSRGLERQFLLAVSHDLRTPLTSIRGFAEAIADGAAPDHERAAEVIAAESRRLERLVGDLLQLAKLDARRFSLDLHRVDIGEVVAATAEGFRPEVDELGLTLAVDLPPGPLFGTVDPDRLAQVVANLVENALKFARTSIAVGTRQVADEVLIVVDDDGPGIPPADIGHVFERLYQSDRTPARRAGSGLGLAIVAELVGAMGGAVAAESPAATGTRMRVTFPVRKGESPPGAPTIAAT